MVVIVIGLWWTLKKKILNKSLITFSPSTAVTVDGLPPQSSQFRPFLCSLKTSCWDVFVLTSMGGQDNNGHTTGHFVWTQIWPRIRWTLIGLETVRTVIISENGYLKMTIKASVC